MSQRETYHYDPETCSFEKAESTWRDRVAHVGQVVGLAIVLAGLALWGMDAQWIATPEEQTLQVENQVLERQLTDVTTRMRSLSERLDTLAKKDRTLYRRLFQIEPISDDVRQVGIGGSELYSHFDQIEADAASLLRNTSQKLDKLERQVDLQETSYRELYRVAEQRRERLSQLPAIRPVNGAIVSGYGMRRHPILKVRKMHEGVDFLLEKGTPVVATGNGVVEEATFSATYGNHIDVEHPAAGYMTRYAHLSEIPDGIRPGVEIERGDTIGYSGNTGRSTGPHLHYEVLELSSMGTLDPMRFFVPDMSPRRYRELKERTQRYRADTLATAANS